MIPLGAEVLSEDHGCHGSVEAYRHDKNDDPHLSCEQRNIINYID